MPFIEPVMRAMTHLNIGAAIALLAWILWSGQQIVRSDVPVVVRSFPTQLVLPHAVHTPAAQLQAEATP